MLIRKTIAIGYIPSYLVHIFHKMRNEGQNLVEQIVATLWICTNVQELCIMGYCNMTNELLTPIISLVRGHCGLQDHSIQIGSAGCEIWYSLLEYPKVQFQSSHSWALQYYPNNAGANVTILDQKHNTLKELDVGGNLL